ncbi:uncharacterized protein LOC132949123 [Metopolophium dirhodum]|uniref:uncharacterized protein LOC132949123 n=1 Tax=Metopolophium dirhodum TaxID=44670 RepID=UPI0029904AC5|nr:uncharacterized protein LOC132949123 [Metopolophium dirhodum]
MSTMVMVTVALTLPCVLLVEQPSNEYDSGRHSIAFGVRAPPMFTLAEMPMKILHPVDQHYRRSLEVDDTWTASPTDNGPNYSQIYKNDQSSTHIVSLKSKKNFSENLQDSIHDVSDLEEIENPNEENRWTPLFKPEQLFISNLTSSEIIESVGGLSTPSFEIEVLNSPSEYDEDRLDLLTRQGSMVPELNTYYAPSIGIYYGTGPLVFPNGEMSILVSVPSTNPAVPNTNPQVIIFPESSTNPESSNIMNVKIPTPSSEQYSIKLSNLNWRRVGLLLAFIKLGVVKIKLVGFIKILFFFLFKLKLLLILVLFKIISIFNILLFSKFVVIPLFILPLLPIIVSMISPKFMAGLLSIPGRIIKYNMILGPAYFGKFTPASTSATETNSSTISALSSPLN